VYADVDEHFDFPCDVLAAMAARRLGAACATMVDRLADSAAVPPLHADRPVTRPETGPMTRRGMYRGGASTVCASNRAHVAPVHRACASRLVVGCRPLAEQFPLCAEVRGGVYATNACLVKLTLVAARPAGALLQFASSHRAVGGDVTYGGCAVPPENCLLTGLFSHYQFFAEGAARSIEGIITRVMSWRARLELTPRLGLARSPRASRASQASPSSGARWACTAARATTPTRALTRNSSSCSTPRRPRPR
jgi:hypothetical protein